MDITEARQRQLIPMMPAQLVTELEAGRPVWTTDEVTAEFQILWFAAPLVGARRRSDGQMGSLMFTHAPRYYFCWEPEGTR